MNKVRLFSAGFLATGAVVIVAFFTRRWWLVFAALAAASALQLIMAFTLGGYYQRGYSFSRAERPVLFWICVAVAGSLATLFLLAAIIVHY